MTMPNTEARGSGTESAGQQGGGSAREQIREVKDQVVGQARSSLRQARDRASSSLGESKGQFADQFGTIADALRRTTEHLRSEDQERIAGITDTVARQVDQVGNYLRSKDAMAMRADLENLARRFLKSSQRERRYRGESQSYGGSHRLRYAGYDELSGGSSQLSGGYDEFDEEIELREPSTGRGGYQGGGYAGA
jgi:hypothetical protein